MREVHFSFEEIDGLGPEPGVMRRDNSDIVSAEGLYHMWYTKGWAEKAPYPDYPIQAGYHGRIWHATSPDGLSWTERGCAIDKGPAGSREEGAVFTPNVLCAEGRYWLGYCGIAKHRSLEELHALPDGEFLGVADRPFGPWTRVGNGPFLWPVEDPSAFDSFRVDGLSFLRRNGVNWVYYKGRQKGRGPQETKIGLATADDPSGAWRRHEGNPVLHSGHEVMFWPHGPGVATLVTHVGPQRWTLQYAPDGVSFRPVGKAVNPPDAPSHFCPGAWSEPDDAPGIEWGVSMVKSKDPLPYLVLWRSADLRFDPDAGTG